MGLTGTLKTIAGKIDAKAVAKITAEFADNVNVKNNVVHTVDLRIDLHKHMDNPNFATAKIQPNAQATDKGVREFIRKGNSGSGSHSGTHKIIGEIVIDRTNFDPTDFQNKVQAVIKESKDSGEGSSKDKEGSEDKKKGSSKDDKKGGSSKDDKKGGSSKDKKKK